MGTMQAYDQPFPWKAAAPSLAVSGALLALAICAATVLVVNQRASNEALDQAATRFDAAVKLELSVMELRDKLTNYQLSGDEQAARALAEWQRVTIAHLMQLEQLAKSTRSEAIIVQLHRSLDVLDRQLHELFSARRNIPHVNVDLLLNKLDEEVLAYAQQQRRINEAALDAARSDSQMLTTWTGLGLLVLGLLGAGAGSLAGFSLARGLHQQMIQLTVSVRSAAGSLNDFTNVVGPLEVRPTGDLSHVQTLLDQLAERVAIVVERLQSAEREAMRQDQLAALGQLAAGLAHELRNPLTAIKTLIEAACESGDGNGLDDRDLQVVDEELTRLDATLQAFLDYARPPKLARRSIDLREVVQKTVQLVAPRTERRSIVLQTALPNSPVTLDADLEQLRQVLLNLVLNACDSLGEGGTITVSVRQVPGEQWAEIRVADTGPGLPEAIRDRLFEPFVSTKPSGTGLGLTICRRIVEKHGGTIAAENLPQGGAAFTITLPLNGPAEAANSQLHVQALNH